MKKYKPQISLNLKRFQPFIMHNPFLEVILLQKSHYPLLLLHKQSLFEPQH